MNSWENIKFDYPAIPTMISREETLYLYWLGANYWKNTGHIVEIGPWLGGSTFCLTSGMRDNNHKSAHCLHVFDNFLWRDFMASRAPLPLKDGDSFQAYFESNLSSFSDLVRIHRSALPSDPTPLDKLAASIHTPGSGNVPVLNWGLGEPVEILFVDGAKSWTGFKHLLQVFNEHLIPEESLLVCQDYKFWGAYWVPMMLEYFMDHFDITHNLNYNTVSFRLKRRISEEEFNKMPGYKDLEVDIGIELLERASQRLLNMGDRLGGLILQGCKVRYYLNMGKENAAIRLFRKLEATWPIRIETHTIVSMRGWLEKETDTIYAPSFYWHFSSAMRKIQRIMNRATNRVL